MPDKVSPVGPESVRNTEMTKEELEQQTLALRIKNLARPRWPRYILAALPSVLAICTLVWAFASGYFQTENKLLEIRTQNLLSEEAGLKQSIHELKKKEEELAAERSVLTGQLEEQKRTLNVQRDALLRQFQDDKKKLIEDRQELQNALELDKHKLNIEREILGKERDALKAEVAAAKQQLVLAPVSVRLHELERLGNAASAKSAPVVDIIALLRSDTRHRPEYVTFLKSAAETIDSPVATIALLYALYRGTGDAQWKSQVLEVARAEGAHLYLPTLRLLDEGEWASEDYVDLVSIIMADHDVVRCDRATAQLLGKAICKFPSGLGPLSGFPSVDEYVRAVMIMRKYAEWPVEVYPTIGISTFDGVSAPSCCEGLARLAPDSILVFVAERAMKATKQNWGSTNRRIESLLKEPAVEAAAKKTAFPNLETCSQPDLKKWLADNAKLVELWTEPELLGLRESLKK